jgi:two-component system response regulator
MSEQSVILLVEDDSNDALITQKFLRKAGITHRIIHVNDGREAMNYLTGKKPFTDRLTCPLPVLILLDLKLPNYNGFDVLTWLLTNPALAKIPVVVLTGSIYPEDRKRATDLGAVGYQIKPVDTEEFAAIAKNIRPHLPASPGIPSNC